MNVTSVVLPGNDARVSAMAHSVPSTSETAVERSAIVTDSRTAGHSSRRRSMRSYQRGDSAGGGRLNTDDALTDTASVTTSGASSVRTTSAVTVHITTTAARSRHISRLRSTVALPAPGEQRAGDHDGHGDDEEHHGDRRAQRAVAHEEKGARDEDRQRLEPVAQEQCR